VKVAELRAELDRLDVEIPKGAKKADLVRLLDEVKGGEAAELLGALRNRAVVQSVFGPFNARTMIELPTDLAQKLLGSLRPYAPAVASDAVTRDLEKLREVDEELADSGLAAVAVRMAQELDDPWNSATSKSQCGKSMLEALEQLRDLAPEKEDGNDALDELARARATRLAG
jgi:hypothetical protein